MVLEAERPGGKARHLDWIENFPGFPAGVSGRELADRLLSQALGWGARLERSQALSAGRLRDRFVVRTPGGPVSGRTLCLATGASFRELGLPGEARFRGRGVHHTAFELAGRLDGAAVAVIGGGETAVHQALALAERSRAVHIVFRSRRLRATGRLLSRLAAEARIQLHPATRAVGVLGRDRVRGLHVENGSGFGRVPADRVFVLVGQEARRIPVRGGRQGLFIAGDARGWRFRQAACAAADGLAAAMKMDRFLGACP